MLGGRSRRPFFQVDEVELGENVEALLPRAFGTLAVEAGMKRHLTRWCLARAERSYRRLHNTRETLPNRRYCRSANQPLALKRTWKRCGTYVASR